MEQGEYSESFKKQIIRECKDTKRIGIVANQYGISSSTVNNWIREEKDKKANLQNGVKHEKVMAEQLKEFNKRKESYEKRMQSLAAKLYHETYRTKMLLKAIRSVLDTTELDPEIKSMLEEATAKAQDKAHREEYITK